jgi:hypothetical protein
MTRVRGSLIVILSLVVLAAIAVATRRGLQQVSSERFVITVQAVPPAGRKLPVDRPLRVRIEKRRAGRPGHKALALLLSGDGRLLSEVRPLRLAQDEDGKVVEEADFPPLQQAPRGGVVAVVARVPQVAPTAELTAALEQQARVPAAEHQQVYSRILALCRQHGGHAEMIAAEVRG